MRLDELKQMLLNRKNEGPVGEHFAQKNHSILDMFFFAIEKVVKDDPFIVGARERFYIDKMDVLRKGINKNDPSPPSPSQF